MTGDGSARRALALTLAAGWMAGLACDPAPAPQDASSPGSPPGSPPHVVLISIDTLRADHVGLYGYDRPTTPRLDALGAESLVFERAYSSASHTLPAHASLLTGVEPRHHGVLTSDDALPAGFATLGEVLKTAGYQTGAFVNAGYLHRKFGLARGFDAWDFAHNQQPRAGGAGHGRTAEETNRAIEAWLDGLDPARPFFLFVHYYDVHSDWGELAYEAPAAIRARFERERPDAPSLRPGDDGASVRMQQLNRERTPLGDAELDWLRSLYDAGIAYTDAQLGALLDALDARGALARSVVIVTSDHGEEFQEHGLLLHEQVYEELMRVPLVVRLPDDGHRTGPTRGRIDALVRHVDILPSVLAWAGLAPPTGIAGQSVLPLVAGDDGTERIAVLRNQAGSQLGVTDGRYKLVAEPGEKRARLFDLTNDPDETIDRSRDHGQEATRLTRARRRHLDRARVLRGATAPVDAETARALRALGYVEPTADESEP